MSLGASPLQRPGHRRDAVRRARPLPARTELRSIDEIIRKFAALGVLREVEPGPPAVIEGTGWRR